MIDHQSSGSFNTSTEFLLEQHRFSKDRRRFILFSAFDFGLITILWIIYTVTKSPDWKKDFDEQCNFTNARFFVISLFDIVVLSLVRFLWLFTFYGCLALNHWWPVGISTCVTTLFLLTKVVYFFLESINQPGNPLAYAIPICSFVICWIELYLLDVQVLPREQFYFDVSHPESSGTGGGPRRSVLRRFDGGHVSDYRTATELSSSDESDQETNGGQAVTTADGRKIRMMQNGEPMYRTYGRSEFQHIARKSMALSKHMYLAVDTWPMKKSIPLVRSTMYENYGRIFYLKLDLKVPVEYLFDLLYTKCELIPTWNQLVLEVKSVMRVDEFTDIMYSVSAPALRNYIASRDFLDVRHYEVLGRTYYISHIFVRSDLRTPVQGSKVIRGENGPNLYVLKPSHVTEDHSTLEWIMNTNLKGNLPKKIVDNSLVQFLVKFSEHLENRLKVT